MHYLIDGYNLIGKINIISFSDINKEQKLIDFISHNVSNIKDRFTLVFDGKNIYEPFGSKTKAGKFTSIFTPNDQSADDYILDYIKNKKNLSGLTIISSDREITTYAKYKRALYCKSEDFIKKLLLNKPNQEKTIKHIENDNIDYWLNKFKNKK
jgi:predicted RNA-binding protein with PIN domain